MGKTFLPTGLFLFLLSTITMAKEYSVKSPDGNLEMKVSVEDGISITFAGDETEVLDISSIAMVIDGNDITENPRVRKTSNTSVNEMIEPLYGINKTLQDNYNELTLQFRGDYSFIVRVYNNGAAYRFQTTYDDEIIVENETADFVFRDDYQLMQLGNADSWHGYETNYSFKKISKSDSVKYKCLPLGVHVNNQFKVAILEADLLDYPGMYLTNSKSSDLELSALFPPYPTKVEKGGHNGFNMVVQETADYIAKTDGNRSFPWRVIAFARDDKDFLDNDIVYLLASESKIGKATWVKPGKVAWDWWNAMNMYGVDFETGFNTETYKYFIDFAAENNIEYINLDEGWSDQFDLMDVTDKLNLDEVVNYANSKNVGVILWCVWHTLDRQMQEALDQFEDWGIVGVKVDFMDRDDQLGVQFYERLLSESAKRKIFVNYHGAYKPAGLRRTYPNLINREAVLGLEYSKWSEQVTPDHDLVIPFLRMMAGPMDYTPGAMINATAENFCPRFDKPMSQGTRCHQLAMFVAYRAPLQMLADAPTNYQADPEVLSFLSDVPVSWDQTVPVDGKIGEFLVIARKKNNVWYVSAMNNWEAHDLTIDFSFLEEASYDAVIYEDGINAERNAIDYKKSTKSIEKGDMLDIHLAPGGGWVAVLKPSN
jgi:alpha-glucosidase